LSPDSDNEKKFENWPVYDVQVDVFSCRIIRFRYKRDCQRGAVLARMFALY